MSGSVGQTALDVVNAGQGAQQVQNTGAMQSAASQIPAPQQAAPLPPVQTQTQDTSTLDQNLKQISQNTPAQAAPTQGAPSGGVKPVAQSETTPDESKQAPANTGRPMVDPRPYALLAEHDPARRAEVDQIAQSEGISPQRLAAHWHQESGFAYNAPDGKAGEKGPVQILPSTAKDFNDHGNLDVSNPHDNLRIAGKLIRSLDDQFGKDSVSSVMAYQGGAGSANDIAANPDQADAHHPNTMAYARSMFPGYDIGGKSATPGGKVDPSELVKNGVQQGPDGLLKYVVQSAPGMNMTDAWQHAEGSLVRAFAMKGDMVGAQHARDFMLQMSHQGSNMHLMAAHQAMVNGDTTGAAQHLAAAHAFFPDGTMGQFGVDKSGNLWGQRMDEHNPGQVMGQSFRVTPDGIAAMLNQTQDPQQYLKMMMEQRQNAATARHLDKMGDYYGNLLQNKTDVANINANSREVVGQGHDDARVQAAVERNAGRTGVGSSASLVKDANKEATGLYGPDAMPTASPEERANLSELHVGARQMGATGQSAEYMARGLQDKTLHLLRGGDGSGQVQNAKGATVGYLPPETVERVFGRAPAAGGPQQAAPIGRPAPVGSGIQANLSGTVQPETSAIPPRTGA